VGELLAIGIAAAAALLLRLLVGALLERIGVRPADDAQRSRGLRDVLVRLRDRRAEVPRSGGSSAARVASPETKAAGSERDDPRQPETNT